MAFTLAPFQVYITTDGHHVNDGGWRVGTNDLVTFPCRSAADEYWRRVQEAVYGDRGNQRTLSYAAKRQHPQYFEINSHWRMKSQVTVAKSLCIVGGNGSVGLSFRPSSELRPDNLNGGRYYIRSEIRPNLFWYFNPHKHIIEISSQFQTRFVIRRKAPLPFQCRPEDDILIGEDDINIFVAKPDWDETESPDIMIVKDSRKLLMAASTLSLSLSNASSTSGDDQDEVSRVVEAGLFKFKMFDGGFGVMDNRSWDGKPVYASANTGGGERWEFAK